LRAPRANHVFGTDEKRIRTKYMVMDKSNHGLGSRFIRDRRLCADVLFIRARSVIRADGFSSAHNRAFITTERLRAPLRQFLTGIKAAPCVCAYISPH
jgi:hypothetical protein